MSAMANSLMLSLPNNTAPASLSFAITVASSPGTFSLRMLEPPVVRMPAVLNWSFTATGTPCSAPR